MPDPEPSPPAAETPAPAPTKPAKPARSPKPAAGAKPAGPGAKKPSPPAPKPVPPAKAAPAPKPSPPPPTAAPPKGTVVDASGLVLGRAASEIAKRLLQGEPIVVVNAEKSGVTGGRASVLGFYRDTRARGSVRSGPHYPRYPDRIFRRTVRGMLPHLKTRGKEALDRLTVHIGVPPELSGAGRVSIDSARARPALRTPTTLVEITRLLGARL